MNEEKIKKVLLWAILGLSIFFGILKIFPSISYIIIIAGIVIPSYIIYKKYKEENE